MTEWGAVCKGNKANSFWTEKEENDNINSLDLNTAYYGLKCFAADQKHCHILLRIDNSTAIYILHEQNERNTILALTISHLKLIYLLASAIISVIITFLGRQTQEQ